ncbi:MAG: pre-peptidase C-terminal domain-containing protein, partial [Planctomycetales bacterium]|nr:pre-peptidase C-terminal domain-containing protein [Planctomycetales bacterium]
MRRLRAETLEARRMLAGDAWEPNPSFAQAADLGSGDQLLASASIDVGGDLDFYRWQASADGTATFEARFLHSQGDLDLEIYDSAFQLLGRSNSQTNNELVRIPVELGENYYVKAFEFTTIGTVPNYVLQISEILPDALEGGSGNNGPTSATALGQGFIQNLTLHRSDDEDWFAFTAPNDGNLRVAAEFAHVEGDLDLQLLDAESNVLTSSSSGTDNESLFRALSSGEQVFVRAYGAAQSVQPGYSLGLTFTQAPQISLEGAIRTFPNETGTIELTLADPDTPLSDLTITATASDPLVAPTGNIAVVGAESTRTLAVRPAVTSGFTSIQLTVSDPEDNTATTTVSFTVGGFEFNLGPRIGFIPAQTTRENQTLGPLAITVSDFGDDPGDITLVATSSDQAILPDANLVLGGSGSNRTLTLTPAANAFGGPVEITLTATNLADETHVQTFQVNVFAETAPTISSIANQTTNQDTSVGPLSFTVGDVDDDPNTLTVTVRSGNEAMFPSDLISLGGSGASRTITLAPAAGQYGGPLPIEVIVSDGEFSAVETFTITTIQVNNPPTISNIPDQTLVEDQSSGTIPFTISDDQTPASSLSVSVSSNNQTLVPNANLVLGGSGNNRTLTVTPAPNAVGGPATITVTVSDGNSSAQETFTVNVTAVNDQPNFDSIANQSINEDAGLQTLTITGVGPGGGPDEAGQTVSFTATSSNPALIPNPTVTGTGSTRTLSYTPAANASGSVTITVTATDNGGTAGGGVNTRVRTFTIDVAAVNDEPTFAAIANQTVLEDAGLQTVSITGVA